MNSRLTTNLTGWLLAFVFIGSIAGSQYRFDTQTSDLRAQQKKRVLELEQPLVPNSWSLRFLSLGYREPLADILWLQLIQYFGKGNPYGEYPALGPLLKTSTDIDPQFAAPYEFGLVALPFMKGADTAIDLGLKARENLPNNGLLTYYLATVYHLNKKDYANAAKYYQLASALPDSPTAAKTLAATALSHVETRVNDRIVAANFWKTVAEGSKNEEEKKRATNWFYHMVIVYELEGIAEKYKQTTGTYPASLDDFVAKKLIKNVPASPVQRALDYNPQTGKINFDRLAKPNN